MSVFRKYDSNSKQWKPVASSDATTIHSGNPVLTEGTTGTVEDILLRDRNDIELLKKNVSWLAKHGGGGGYGGGGGAAAKATVNFLSPSDNTTPVDSIIWKDSIQFIRVKITSSYNGTYTLIVKSNGKSIFEQQNVKRNTVIDIPTAEMGVGKTGVTLEALAYDEAEMEYSAVCKITVASVELQKPVEITVTQNQLVSGGASISLPYRTSIPGNYYMYYSNTMITYDPNMGWRDSDGSLHDRSQYIDMQNVGTTVSTLAVNVNDLIESGASPGIYSRYFVMVSALDPTICSSVQSSQIIVIVTNGLLVSPQIGTDPNEPYLISLDGILNLRFITYAAGSMMGTYSYSLLNGDNVVKEEYGQIYGTIITVPLTINTLYDKEGNYELTLRANGGGYTSEAKIYLRVVESTTALLNAYKQDINNYCIFDYTFWDKSTDGVDTEATFVNNAFKSGGSTTTSRLTQKMNIYNKGVDSLNTKVFYKMRHTCVAELNSNGYKWFPSDITDTRSLIAGSSYVFSLSIAYRIDREVSDNTTVFNLGNYSPTSLGGDGSGYGILITAHGAYVHLENTVLECELSDNDFSQIDIVVKPHVNAGAYLLCIYQNATLTAATQITFIPSAGVTRYTLGDVRTATVACRSMYLDSGFYSTVDSINMDLYSVKFYATPLNDGQIICNYINNRANFLRDTENNTLNATLINTMLTNNFIKPDSEVEVIGTDDNGDPIYDTSDICKVFDMTNGSYDWGVRIENNEVNLGNLSNIASIPIVVVDAYNWKFNSDFKGGNAQTAATDGKITYIDGGKTIQHNVTVALQGTTTLTYEMKNIDVTFKDATFTPKDSWFPEQTFTLKADIVDSGHMNNATIGTFVNKCLNETSLLNKDAFPVAAKIHEFSRANGQKMPDSMKLKACIEGFPIVLVMSFLSESGEAREAHVLGVYSFNLGRKSYVNQGFEVLKCLRNLDGSEVNADTITYPALFAIPAETDKDDTYQAYCFEGDDSYNCGVTNDNEIDINDTKAIYDYAKVKIGNTGEKNKDWAWFPTVSEAGGYAYYLNQPIYDTNNVPVVWNSDNVKKIAIIPNGYFWSDDASYMNMWKTIYTGRFPANAVSSFRQLMTCIASKLQYNKGLYMTSTGKVPASVRAYNTSYPRYVITSASDGILTTEVSTDNPTIYIETPQAPEPIELSVRNSAFYYIVCMLFGLVDSFGKNMQMKNWALTSGGGAPLWSPTFYDMDTALGIDNVGAQSVPPTVFDESLVNTPDNKVAFLYGMAPQSSNGLFTVYSNKMWGGLDNAMFQRQYKPDYGSEENYQVYATMWSELRRSMINNPDEFVDTYMSTQLTNCGEFLYNYDYDQKYTRTEQISMLHGTRVSYIKNWLKERIIFLDSVFGYKSLDETTYLEDPNVGATPPFISMYNVPWKNEARLVHNTGALNIPIVTNNSVIMKTTVGNSSSSYTYVPKNIKTRIPVGQTLSTPNIQTLINNSDCIIDMDTSGIDIIGVQGVLNGAVRGSDDGKLVSYYSDYSTLPKLYNQYGSFASLKKLDLRNAALNEDYELDYFTIFKTWDSTPYGVSPEPFKLEELNLSGIKSANVSANLSGLTENISAIPAIYKAPFTNVTKIDVSNSNISTVTIPSGVSLYGLNITNSKIQTLILKDQPLLPAPNFNGCTNLTSITLVNCSRFTSLTFNNTTKSLQTLVISGCKNLETLTINAGDLYAYLPAISVEDCPKLRTIRISGCTSKDATFNTDKKLVLSNLPALESLNVAGCHFEIIEWDGVYAKNETTGETVAWSLDYFGKEGWSRQGLTNLKTLNISSSHVGTIYSRYYGTKTGINLEGFENGINLEGFSSTNLTTLNCSNNAYIEEVYFNNNFRTPFYISTPNAFNRCTNLRRVYGFTILNAVGIFDACASFSIHGTSTSTSYAGKDVYDSILNAWLHPMDMDVLTVGVDEEIGDEKVGTTFQEGSKVTNMVLGGTDLSYCFRSTACTTFDVYYALMNIYPSVLTINYLFHGASNVDWGWGSTYSNDPHRYMFAKCQHVTNAQIVFQYCGGRSGGAGRLWSPYYDEHGQFVPGIFTPLKNIGGYNCMFWPMSGYVIDKNIFMQKDGADNTYTYLRYFTPRMVVNDVNNLTYDEYSNILSNPLGYNEELGISNSELHGDISGFFKNMPYMTDILGLFNNVLYINYSKFGSGDDFTNTLGLPKMKTVEGNRFGVSTLQGCLTSLYASGELSLAHLFEDGDVSGLENIYNSIRVLYSGGTKEDPINLKMYVRESLFQDCSNLRNIGYKTGTDFAGDNTTSAFSGNGLKKVLPNGEFPYNLLLNNDKLESFVAFFNGCDMKDVEVAGQKLELPGSLFKSCPNLKDISYCFYDIVTNNPIILSSEAFSECPKLSVLSYAFGCSSNHGKSSVRESALPLRFFYTGSETVTKELRGTNFTKTVSGVTFREGTTIKTAVTTLKSPSVTTEGNVTTTVTYTREYTNFDNYAGDDTKIIITPVTNMVNVTTTVTSTTNNGVTTNSTPKRVTEIYYDSDFEINDSNFNIKSYVFEYEEMNRSINNLAGCFQYADFSEYVADYGNYAPESNKDFQPYDYIIENNKWKKVAKNNVRTTWEWVYDGDRAKYWSDAKDSIKLSEKVGGVTYTYEHSLPDDAWVEEATSIEEMLEVISTNCIKPTANNWGNINGTGIVNTCGSMPSNFCLPPDLLRYCSDTPNISKMFYGCGMYSHFGGYPDRADVYNVGGTNNASIQAYGLTGRLCPYLLKPVPGILSLSETFANCSWLGGYQRTGGDMYNYIIPESFFKYSTASSVDLTRTFRGFAFPTKTSLNAFNFTKDVTLCVEETFAQSFFLNTDFNGDNARDKATNLSEWSGHASTITNVFTNPVIYIRGMQKCFCVTTQTVGQMPDKFVTNQFVLFKNVFDKNKYDRTVGNSDYYVFCGYNFLYDEASKRTEIVDNLEVIVNERFGLIDNRTVRDDTERHNYDARNNPNVSGNK